jgi:hypothetical protein
VAEGHDGRFEIISWTQTGHGADAAIALPPAAKAA